MAAHPALAFVTVPAPPVDTVDDSPRHTSRLLRAGAHRLAWMCAEDDPADQQTETVAMQPNFSGRSYVSCSYLVPWEIWPAADGHNDPGGRMKPRITVLTIAVDDLERALDFYANGLGLPTRGIVGREFEHGAVAFFDLERGLKLAIWPREDLAHDSGLPRTPPSVTEFSIGHTVRTEQEVDAVMRQAKRAGATIVKPARKTFWGGYAGYFTDPDGHLWEVAFNPSLLPDE